MEKIISGIFSLLLGGLGLWTGIRQLRNLKTLNLWNTTTGKVIEKGSFQPQVASLSVPAFRYAPLVKYSYQVDGKEFVNNCIQPKRIQAPRHSSRKWAEKQAESFPDEVVVHYNSEDPSESYLIMTSRVVLWFVVLVSVLLILFGAAILLVR